MAVGVELTADEISELRALVQCPDIAATVATRARIVLWRAGNLSKKEIAESAGVSRPTVDLWLSRYAADGLAGLLERPSGAGREQVPGRVRARILAASRVRPPAETGLSHWSSREMAAWISCAEGVPVSHHYVAKLWRDNGIQPHRHGTFKLGRDPGCTDEVAGIVGLYLLPPAGVVVLGADETTRVPEPDRTQPLPVIVLGSAEVHDGCPPAHDAASFLEFLETAVEPHVDKKIRVVLEGLCTHTAPEVTTWFENNPHVRLHHTPACSSWVGQIEVTFGVFARQAVRCGTFSSAEVLIGQTRDYIGRQDAGATPFTWIAAAGEPLAKVRVVQTTSRSRGHRTD